MSLNYIKVAFSQMWENIRFLIELFRIGISNVEKRYVQMKEKVTSELSFSRYVCTTADIWSAHNRSFFGITAHWIDTESLARRSVASSCSRFRGKHSFDAIATILEQIHLKFGITGKV